NHVGQFLKVVMTNPDGTPKIPNMAAFDQLTTLNLKNTVGLPQATTYMNLFAGLPSGAQIGAPANTQAKLVFDQKGNQYNVVMSYAKVASYTANGAGFPTDNPTPGGPADPPNSERWTLTATATTNANPPVPVVVNAAWTNG